MREFIAFALSDSDDLEAFCRWDPETGIVYETTSYARGMFLHLGVPLDVLEQIGRKWPTPDVSAAARRPASHQWQSDLFDEL